MTQKRLLQIGGVGCLIVLAAACLIIGRIVWVGTTLVTETVGGLGGIVTSGWTNSREFLVALSEDDFERAQSLSRFDSEDDIRASLPEEALQIEKILGSSSARFAENGRGEIFYTVELRDGTNATLRLYMYIEETDWLVSNVTVRRN